MIYVLVKRNTSGCDSKSHFSTYDKDPNSVDLHYDHKLNEIPINTLVWFGRTDA